MGNGLLGSMRVTVKRREVLHSAPTTCLAKPLSLATHGPRGIRVREVLAVACNRRFLRSALANERAGIVGQSWKLNASLVQFELFTIGERSNRDHRGRLKMQRFLPALQYPTPRGPNTQELSMNVMNRNINRKLLASAIVFAFAAISAHAFADETANGADNSSMKMDETMTHDTLMNHEDAGKHDKLVKHDLAVKKAAADKAAMKESAARKNSAAEETATTEEALDTKQERMNERMEASKDVVDTKQQRMNERMEAKKDVVDARQERMNENMDAEQEAVEARKDAKEEILENKAEAKKEKVDALDSTQPVTDTWITTKVKSELAVTEGVSSLKITVDTVDGVVFLTGVVDSAANAAKATAAANGVQGVRKVDSSGLKSM
jgi:hyperosmotically inducible periplasmic protein